MNMWFIAFAAIYLFLALGHSVLGERAVIQPLFADTAWKLSFPRRPAEHLLRMTWHEPSLTWVLIALLGFGAARDPAIAQLELIGPITLAHTLVALSVINALTLFVLMRGHHFAWLFFAGAALTAHLGSGGLWFDKGSTTLGLVGAAVFVVLGGLHVYWLFGGRGGLEQVVPLTERGKGSLTPPKWATLIVMLALFAIAGLMLSVTLSHEVPYRPTLLALIGGAFALRAMGDFNYLGIFKRKRAGAFARWDSMLYIPLCALLATLAFTLA